MRRLVALLVLGASSVAPAACDRTAFVDAEGVMRWTDDRSEVAVFGANYYTPFHVEYQETLWGGGRRLGAVQRLKTEGVSGGCYCTGLRHGHALDEPQLRAVKEGQFAFDERLNGKAKIVYEFDAADVTGAYMYPAMARLFRSQGIQSATAFQYESTPIADDNTAYMTHYLHLVYTPEKALSLAIAAEAFRRLPRGCAFATNAVAMSFPPFRVDVRGNLSEVVTETDYLYTASSASSPPTPEKLCRVWGCGSSVVVASTGNGAYFLDRVDDGLWRLQLFPSVMPCADPFSGNPGVKVAILSETPTLTIWLPDLGERFECWDAIASLRRPYQREMKLPPGDYILVRKGTATNDRLARARQFDLPMWWSPPPHPYDPKHRRWYVPTRTEMVAAALAKVSTPEKWNFLDGNFIDKVNAWRHRIEAPHFRDENTRSQRIDVKGWLFEEVFPAEKFGRAQTLVVRGQSLTERQEPVELDFGMDDGARWKTDVTLPPEGGEVLVPVTSLRRVASSVGNKGDMSFVHVVELTLRIGHWLYPDDTDRRHGVRIDFVGCRK